jgi:hypothetical protein
MLETITAFSLLLVAILSILPLFMDIRLSLKYLQMEQEATTLLHDEFHDHINNGTLHTFPHTYDIGIKVTLSIVYEDQWMKGCAEWKDHKNNHKEFCLYAE